MSFRGVQLDAVDEAIIIQKVVENAPSWGQTLQSRGNGYGQIQTGSEKKYRDIIVSFVINELTDIVRREEVLQAVRDWASAPGWLRLNYREDQRIYARCVTMPAVNGIVKAAEEYTLTFRSTARPEWEANTADTATATARKTGNIIIKVKPSAGGPLRLSAYNPGTSKCDSVTLSMGNQKIALTGLGLAPHETLAIDYTTEKDIQRIRIQNTAGSWRSVLNKRTTDSSDDIMLACGSNTVTVLSSVNLQWTLTCFGRWYG